MEGMIKLRQGHQHIAPVCFPCIWLMGVDRLSTALLSSISVGCALEFPVHASDWKYLRRAQGILDQSVGLILLKLTTYWVQAFQVERIPFMLRVQRLSVEYGNFGQFSRPYYYSTQLTKCKHLPTKHQLRKKIKNVRIIIYINLYNDQ